MVTDMKQHDTHRLNSSVSLDGGHTKLAQVPSSVYRLMRFHHRNELPDQETAITAPGLTVVTSHILTMNPVLELHVRSGLVQPDIISSTLFDLIHRAVSTLGQLNFS